MIEHASLVCRHIGLCYFAIFIHVPNDSNKLCIISNTATTKTSVVSLRGLQPVTAHVEGGNYYADKLLFLNCLRFAVFVTLNTL